MQSGSMKNYNDKRDFQKTTEPKEEPSYRTGGKPIFVIQKHDATNLHYDFRLEIDHTLKSWSVPKGPSTDPSVKRMAIPTEDHPVSYADFEGTIPQEAYGGGTVLIWDRGTISSNKKDDDGNLISLKDSWEAGSIAVILEGKKLKGGYNLVKMKGGSMKGNWLLMKQDDDEADARRNPVSTEQKSVVSGKSLQEIAKDHQQEH
jgi:DNA ligase D-like protein (predicted 3'-phosphoesterase)